MQNLYVKKKTREEWYVSYCKFTAHPQWVKQKQIKKTSLKMSKIRLKIYHSISSRNIYKFSIHFSNQVVRSTSFKCNWKEIIPFDWYFIVIISLLLAIVNKTTDDKTQTFLIKQNLWFLNSIYFLWACILWLALYRVCIVILRVRCHHGIPTYG